MAFLTFTIWRQNTAELRGRREWCSRHPERYIPNKTKLGNSRAELSLIMGKCGNIYTIQTPFENSFKQKPNIKSVLMIKNKLSYRIYKKSVEKQETTNARILYEYNTKQRIERPLPTALGVFPYVNTRKWKCKRTQNISAWTDTLWS